MGGCLNFDIFPFEVNVPKEPLLKSTDSHGIRKGVYVPGEEGARPSVPRGVALSPDEW